MRIGTGFKPPKLRHAVLAMIRQHTYPSGIHSAVIEKELDLRGKQVRKAIAWWRLARMPICSGSKGYSIGIAPSDLDGTIEHLEGRYRAIGILISAMKATQRDLEIGKPAQLEMI